MAVSSQLGLRERNKLDKLRRIKQAARELFISKGFDDTTTREIATRADVGMGTVFLYADNKRDLLFLIANDELDAIITAIVGSFRQDADVLGSLCATFRPIYEYFGGEPALSRLTLREMTFYEKGQQARRFQASREQLIGAITRIIKVGQERGEIVKTEKADFIAWIAFCIYQVELRRWLIADEPDINAGMARLRRALKLYINGVSAQASASARRAR